MVDVKKRNRGLIRLLALAAVIAGGILIVSFTPLGEYLSREGVARGVEILRGSALAPLIFVPLYAGAVALGIPGTIDPITIIPLGYPDESPQPKTIVSLDEVIYNEAFGKK